VLGVVANLFKGRDMFGKGDAIEMLTGRLAGVCSMSWVRGLLLAVLVLGAAPAQAANCGHEGQRACTIFERIPSCDPNLVEVWGTCVHPGCGREGERACTVVERIPSCDANLIESNGQCVLPTPCGGESQRPCKIWERLPSCDAYLVEQPLGVSCVHPGCGRENERACTVVERIPSCDANLIESNGKCVVPMQCGGEGQRPCLIWERLPSCDAYLVEQPLGVSCVHPACGRESERPCTLVERIPSCDADLIEVAGRCLANSPCSLDIAHVPVQLDSTPEVPTQASASPPIYVVSKTVPAVAHPVAEVEIGAGDKLVGGGAWVDWHGVGNLLKQSAPSGMQKWVASAKDHGQSDPTALTVYALGLRDPDGAWETIVVETTGAVAAHPTATAIMSAGYVLVGGGCRVNVADDAPGNLLTASFPASPTSWECQAKDHSVSSPASVTAFVVGIRSRDPNVPLPEVQIDSATSAVGSSPEVEARPSRVGFVVTGGGARADASPSSPGQLLTRSAPLAPDTGATAPAGWVARSKDHLVSSPASVTAFVVSVKFDSALPAPTNLVATRVDNSTVHLEWTAVANASGYRIWRNGQLIEASHGTTSFNDYGLPDGRHAYAVQSFVGRTGASDLVSPLSPETRIRTGPFTVVAVGDSVTWGQGLTDEHKYTGMVKQWIETNLGTDVKLVVLAHSGALVLRPQGFGTSVEARVTPGEVPNAFPTISGQVEFAAAQLATPVQVDLVIVGGCINDVGLMPILNPVSDPAEVSRLAAAACGVPVTDLLVSINEKFPDARIVLTGYFPIASRLSDLSGVGTLLGTAGVVTASGAAALGIPIIDPVTGAIAGAILSEVAKALVAANAHVFYADSTKELARAARAANSRIGGKASFACTPFRAENAYAAPQSWLWLAPIGPVHDEIFDERGVVCGDDIVLTTAGATPESLDWRRLQCQEASIGHPNVAGAQAYFEAIREQIEPFLTAWKARLAPGQPAR
jgi:hypothetical protein